MQRRTPKDGASGLWPVSDRATTHDRRSPTTELRKRAKSNHERAGQRADVTSREIGWKVRKLKLAETPRELPVTNPILFCDSDRNG